MIQVCKCDDSFKNTGEALCKALLSYGAGTFAFSYFDADGNINEIDLENDVLDQSYIDDKINESDPYKRWFPIMGIKNIEDVLSDVEFETFDDNTKYPVNEGIRSWTGIKPDVTPRYVGNIKSFGCGKVGIIIIGAAGELQGDVVYEDGVAKKFRGFLVSPGTWVARYQKPKPKERSKLLLSFDFDQTNKDENIGVILPEEFDNVNMLLVEGLRTVYSEIISATTTLVKFRLFGEFGTPLVPDPIINLVSANFTLFNVTDNSSIGFTGSGGAFAESPDGTYTITYNTADQPASADKIRITPSKNGYDFAAVVANQATTA